MLARQKAMREKQMIRRLEDWMIGGLEVLISTSITVSARLIT
jgi:hypothetical protein